MYAQNKWIILCSCARKAIHNRTFWRTLVWTIISFQHRRSHQCNFDIIGIAMWMTYTRYCVTIVHIDRNFYDIEKPGALKGYISYTWEQCATFLRICLGGHLSFLITKHKLSRERWDLTSCQISLNSVQRLQRRRRKCLSQSEAGHPSWFSDRPEKHTLGTVCWDIAS